MKTSAFTLLCIVAVAQGSRINLLNDNNLESLVESSHLTEALLVCSNTDSDNILVAHENCDKYYICAHGTPVAVKCPANTLYNSNKGICDWSSNVECGDRVISKPEDESGTGDGNSNGSNDTTDNNSNENDSDSNNDSDNETCNCNPEEAPSICAGADSDNILIANENCDRYYICAHGSPVAVKCPANTLYNPYKRICDWSSNVECGDRVITESEDESGAGEGDSNDSNDTTDNNSNENDNDSNNDSDNETCNCNPEEAPSICAGADSDNILIANENCDKYYICAHGTPVALKCPADTLYNPYKGICDWSSNVECGDRVISEPEDESGAGEGDSDDSNNTTDNNSNENDNNSNNESDNETCNCNPEEAPSICAGADSDNILIANENCDKYYICAHGTPVALKCPADTLYNPYKGICDWSSNVECGDRVISEPEDGSGAGEGDSNDSNDTTDNNSNENDNDSNNDSDNETCNCNPEKAPSICAGADSDNILIANENCDKYYICAHGTPVALKCPTNTLYNPYKGICDWESNVECGDRVISEPENESGTDEGNDRFK